MCQKLEIKKWKVFIDYSKIFNLALVFFIPSLNSEYGLLAWTYRMEYQTVLTKFCAMLQKGHSISIAMLTPHQSSLERHELRTEVEEEKKLA